MTKNNLYTVRIMAINIREFGSREILIVHTITDDKGDMKNIRIYLHNDYWDKKHLNKATTVYNELVKYRLRMKKRVYTKHIYNAYSEIQAVGGVEQLYIKKLKAYRSVLRKPRANYSEVKSDTFRLYMIDKAIKEARKIIQQKTKEK